VGGWASQLEGATPPIISLRTKRDHRQGWDGPQGHAEPKQFRVSEGSQRFLAHGEQGEGRESGASQHSVRRFLAGDSVHPYTRSKLEQAIEKLENTLAESLQPPYPGAPDKVNE
jgi:hypothetical protein